MLSVRGIYDGESILPNEKIDFKSRKNVIITFLDDAANLKIVDEQMSVSKSLKNGKSGHKHIDLHTLSKLGNENRQKIIREICESAALMYKNNSDLIIDSPIDFVEY